MIVSRFLHSGLLVAALGSAILTGCDRTVEEKTKTTEGPNGSTVNTEKTVQHPDGTITQEKESSTTKP